MKNANLEYIDQCFDNIKRRKDVDKNINSIEKALERLFIIDLKYGKKTFKINLMKNTTGDFVGMCCYPRDMGTLSTLLANAISGNKKCTADMISDVWSKMSDWVIEIDEALLYDRKLNASPSEITAVLLHELGHVVYSDQIPQRVYRVTKMLSMKVHYSTRELISNFGPVSSLFDMIFIKACSVNHFKYNIDRSEISADMFAYKLGYGDHLESLLHKIIVCNGNSDFNKSSKDLDNDIEIITNWTLDNIAELKYRHTRLNVLLKTEMIRTPSKFIKQRIENIKTSLGMNEEQRIYERTVTESALLNAMKKSTEIPKKLLNSMNKIKPVTNKDVDKYRINMMRVNTINDKIYLLEDVYELRQRVQMSLDLLNAGDPEGRVTQTEPNLKRTLNEIDDLINEINSIKIDQREKYGMYVKYPDGYEG